MYVYTYVYVYMYVYVCMCVCMHAVSCPTSTKAQCNGHGRCLTMADMAQDRDDVHTKVY